MFIGLGGAVVGLWTSRSGRAVVVLPIVLMPHLSATFSPLGQTYQYTEDLSVCSELGGALRRSVEGVMPIEAWDRFLSSHVDQWFEAFLQRGIAAGLLRSLLCTGSEFHVSEPPLRSSCKVYNNKNL